MSSSNALRQPTRRERLIPAGLNRIDILGVIGLRCQVTLRLEVEDSQAPLPFSFVVDSGASYSLISLTLAQHWHLPVPPPESEVELPLRSAGGIASVRVRPGRMRGWWDEELRGYPFDWPVLFRVDAPLSVPSLLGLGGIIKTCRWTFDGQYSPDSPYGYLILDDIR